MCDAPSTWRASTWAIDCALAQRRVQRVDRRARHAEGLRNAFLFHHQHRGHRRLHLCHRCLLGGEWEKINAPRHRFGRESQSDV